jgi:hypothetical protein
VALFDGYQHTGEPDPEPTCEWCGRVLPEAPVVRDDVAFCSAACDADDVKLAEATTAAEWAERVNARQRLLGRPAFSVAEFPLARLMDMAPARGGR